MDSLQDFLGEKDLPPHLKEMYEELSEKGYSEETMEQFALFSLEVVKYHRVRAESEDIEE
jgi:hypothetical protein